MTREEVVENLGTIARSGTREFLEPSRGQAAAAARADRPVRRRVSTRLHGRRSHHRRQPRAPASEATRWESVGDGSYTLGPAERPAAGTTVTLHLKPQDEEDGLNDYTQPGVLRGIVKRYSDFVAR